MQKNTIPTRGEASLLEYAIILATVGGAACLGWLIVNIAKLFGVFILSLLIGGAIAFFSSYTFWPCVGVTFAVIFIMQWLASRGKNK